MPTGHQPRATPKERLRAYQSWRPKKGQWFKKHPGTVNFAALSQKPGDSKILLRFIQGPGKNTVDSTESSIIFIPTDTKIRRIAMP